MKNKKISPITAYPSRLVFRINNPESAGAAPVPKKTGEKSGKTPDQAKSEADKLVKAGLKVEAGKEEISVGEAVSSFQNRLISMINKGEKPEQIKASLSAKYAALIAKNPGLAKKLWNSRIDHAKVSNVRWLYKYSVSFPRSGGIAIDIQKIERQRNDSYFRKPVISKKYGHTKTHTYHNRKILTPSEEQAYNRGASLPDKEAQRERSPREVHNLMNSGVAGSIEAYKNSGEHDDAFLQELLSGGANALLKSLTPKEQSYLEGYQTRGTVKEPWPYTNTKWTIKIRNGKVQASAD